MLAPFRKKAETVEASERVRTWTRERFALPEEAAIMVAEIECQVPGCPPLETVVAFWEPGDETRRYHFKVFKPVAEVEENDLPPSWLKPGLLGEPMFGCPCC
jgi:nitrate reductase delta subunit